MPRLDDIVRHIADPEDRAAAAAAILGDVRRRVRQAEAADSELKRCSRCDEEKPLSEFHRDARRADGRFPHCKRCRP